MKSKWCEYKSKVINLRKRGVSIVKIEQLFKIPRSTLSGWFKDIKLSKKQKEKLLFSKQKGLIKARKKAVVWHNQQKIKRLKQAEEAAEGTIKNIDFADNNIIEIALAMLYLGEGAKKAVETSLGSSNPLILKFFITALKNIYNLDINKIRCELYLRADQNPEKIKKFWSQALKISISNFKQVNVDKRTIGSKTYPSYMGVCNLRCGNSAIQRKLLYLSEKFIKNIIEN